MGPSRPGFKKIDAFIWPREKVFIKIDQSFSYKKLLFEVKTSIGEEEEVKNSQRERHSHRANPWEYYIDGLRWIFPLISLLSMLYQFCFFLFGVSLEISIRKVTCVEWKEVFVWGTKCVILWKWKFRIIRKSTRIK